MMTAAGNTSVTMPENRLTGATSSRCRIAGDALNVGGDSLGGAVRVRAQQQHQHDANRDAQEAR